MNKSANPLPKEAVEEYQRIYFSAYGKQLPYEEAELSGAKLIQLIMLIERAEDANNQP